MRINIFLYISFVVLISTFISCDKEIETIPSYIHINDIVINCTTEQGLPTQKIKEVLVLLDSNNIGVYPVNGTFPVLGEGAHSITLLPVIRNNGISSAPVVYPFLTRYYAQVDLESTKTDSITPVFRYNSDAKFSFVESFNDSNSLGLDLDGDNNNIYITTQGALDGRSGIVSLDSLEHPVAIWGSVDEYDLPNNGTYCYLELDYKNTVPFSVGLGGLDSGGNVLSDYVVVLYPSETWNKVYIDFTSLLQSTKLTNVRVFFNATIIDASTPSGNVLIDNVKLIHY
ncbi:MAG: hypothetical protein KBA06_02080 [Saprospiraceae bacterium]|nr:hypothetical protein [Saprospiraceae bacterium]